MKPISIFLPAEHFQPKNANSNSIAEEMANAIQFHAPFKGHSIVFEIIPAGGGDVTQNGKAICVRT